MILTYLTYSVFWRISSLPGFRSTIQNYVYTRFGLPYSAGLVWLRAVITCPPPPHVPPETQPSENSIHPDMRRHQKLMLGAPHSWALGFLLCVVTEESKSNYFRVSCKKCNFSCKRCTFSCKTCTHHSIINMKSTSLVMFSCSFCRFLFAP